MAERSQRPSDDLLGEDRPHDSDQDDAPSRGSASGGADDAPPLGNPEDDLDSLRERARKQRVENQRLHKQLKELQSKASSDQSVEERAKAAEDERDRIRRELQEERAIRTIMASATRAGAVDVEDVADLMLRRNMIDFDDDGRPQDVAGAIEELKRSKPHLFSTRRVPEADAGRGNGRRAGEGEQKTDWNAAFRRSASK